MPYTFSHYMRQAYEDNIEDIKGYLEHIYLTLEEYIYGDEMATRTQKKKAGEVMKRIRKYLIKKYKYTF